jgi:hypothetical protein
MQSVSNVVRIPVIEGFFIETVLMPVRIRLFFMQIRIWIWSQSAIMISFRLDIIGYDSNVVRIPVIEVFLIETMLMPVRIRLFFYADPDLDLVPICNHDSL